MSKKAVKPCLKIYRVASAARGLNLLAYSEQEAIKQFCRLAKVKPWQAVIWYSYPLFS